MIPYFVTILPCPFHVLFQEGILWFEILKKKKKKSAGINPYSIAAKCQASRSLGFMGENLLKKQKWGRDLVHDRLLSPRFSS